MEDREMDMVIYRKIVYGWAVTLLLIATGCQSVVEQINPTKTLGFAPDENISFTNLPISVQEFHEYTIFDNDSDKRNLIGITWFQRPYANSFSVILIQQDGSLITFTESPDWATYGGTPPLQLNQDELRIIESLLESLVKVNSSITGIGKEVIVVSFQVQSQQISLTCTEIECPKEVQDLFEITDDVFKRDNPDRLLSNPYSHKN